MSIVNDGQVVLQQGKITKICYTNRVMATLLEEVMVAPQDNH